MTAIAGEQKERTQAIAGQVAGGAQRVVIQCVQPVVDCGRFPVKRTVGERVQVTAEIFADGHDVVSGLLCHRKAGQDSWRETPLENDGDDVYRASFTVHEIATYEYTITAWIDRYATWLGDLVKKFEAGMDVGGELIEGAMLVDQAAERAGDETDSGRLRKQAAFLRSNDADQDDRVAAASRPELLSLLSSHPDRAGASWQDRPLRVIVERERAGYGAWYEMFPRSTTSRTVQQGTLRSTEDRLPYIASMGFDVLYLPPIHPIGKTQRKGPNNRLTAAPEDPGSPWAIGSEYGGHKAIDPNLGSLEDFDHFVATACALNIEIALDLAFQCSPDHPYVQEHPEWFRHRPDGTIKYAENPPKKYQDIFPLDFESSDWQSLWKELHSVVLFWIEHGVRIFRVDNPHTKSFRFWEWLISTIRAQYPDVLFLAEAFTRPKLMRYLAKAGFSQSYTYFTWRNTREELTSYFKELTGSDPGEYLRPNLFVNTPDILHEYLQFGGRPAFQVRLVLAATLGASYGIYGPAFELSENRAIPGTEEYQDSEKYQIRHWDLRTRRTLRDYVTRVNRIRRENPALHSDRFLRFHAVDNEQIICYSKSTADGSNTILTVVNLDPHHTQSGWIELPAEEMQLPRTGNYQMHDLLSDARYLWQKERNYVELDPAVGPAHVFRLRRRIRTEHDFDYFL